MTATPGVEAQTTPLGRLHGLTALRFGAAAVVLLHHSIGPNRPVGIRLGFVGVTFFFVLSGFVLAWSYRDGTRTVDFWRNRVARIVPLTWVTLTVAAFVPLALHVSGTSLAAAYSFTQAWFFNDNQIVVGVHDVSWTLSAEMFFYALFPFLVVVLRGRGRAVLAGTALLAWLGQAAAGIALPHLTGYSYRLTYNFPPYRLAEFVVGIALAELWRSSWRPRWSPRWSGAAAALGIFAVVALDGIHPLQRYQASTMAVPVIVALLLWSVAAEHDEIDRWARHRVLVRLGEWSFALYLVHTLVIRVISWGLGAQGPGYLPAIWVVVAVAVSQMLAAAACELIEKPAERRLRAPRRTLTTAV